MNLPNNKRKITQNELRLLMQMKKKKLIETEKKVDSPLAKYTDDGNLMCIICNSVVKTESVWIIHINSKQHRENIAKKKQSLKSVPVESTPPIKKKKESHIETTNVPNLKGILKNKLVQESVPVSNLINHPSPNVTNSADTANQEKNDVKVDVVPNEVPEGFFDDPIMDAKVRNVEYKNPQDEEWEKFQREIQEEIISSEQMLDEDEETIAPEKEREDIDEKMQEWSMMLILEKQAENAQKKFESKLGGNTLVQKMDYNSSCESDEELDEFIDWRSKKSFKM